MHLSKVTIYIIHTLKANHKLNSSHYHWLRILLLLQKIWKIFTYLGDIAPSLSLNEAENADKSPVVKEFEAPWFEPEFAGWLCSDPIFQVCFFIPMYFDSFGEFSLHFWFRLKCFSPELSKIFQELRWGF